MTPDDQFLEIQHHQQVLGTQQYHPSTTQHTIRNVLCPASPLLELVRCSAGCANMLQVMFQHLWPSGYDVNLTS